MWELTASSVGRGPPAPLDPTVNTTDLGVYRRNPLAALPASLVTDRTKYAPTGGSVKTAWTRQSTEAAGTKVAAELKAWMESHPKKAGYTHMQWMPVSSHAAWTGVVLDDARLRDHYADYNVKLMVVWMSTTKDAKVQVSREYWHPRRDEVDTVYVFRKRRHDDGSWQYMTVVGPESDATIAQGTSGKAARKPRKSNAANAEDEPAPSPLKCVKQSTTVLGMHEVVKRGFVSENLATEIRDLLVPQYSKIFHYGALFLEYVMLRRLERPIVSEEVEADWKLDLVKTVKLALLMMTTNIRTTTGSQEMWQYLPDFLDVSGYQRVTVKANSDNIIGDLAVRLLATLKVHYSQQKLLEAVRKFLAVKTGKNGAAVSKMLEASSLKELRAAADTSCRASVTAWKTIKLWRRIKAAHFPEEDSKAQLGNAAFVLHVVALRHKLGAGPLVPHGTESRTFIRIPDSMFADWNERPTIKLLADRWNIGQSYGRSIKECPGPGKYIGNSIITDGFQVHFVTKTIDANPFLVQVQDDEEAANDGGPEAGQDKKTRRYWNRNMTTKDVEGFIGGKSGIYGFQDVGDNPEAVKVIEELARCGLVVGVDPGKIYSATAVNCNDTSKIIRFSQKEYYGQLKYRGAAFAGNGWLWRKRHLFGYQPAYFRAACTGLLTLAGASLASFEAGLSQRNSPFYVPFCKRKNQSLCSTLHGFVKCPQGLHDGSLRREFLWSYQLSPKRALLRFQSYKRRQKLVASFIKRIAPDPRTVILWGDGYDGVGHQRCNMPAPSKKLLRSLGVVRRVVMVSEFRTTRSCCGCVNEMLPHVPTLPVYRQVVNAETGNVSSKEVGSRWCPQCKRTYNRDGCGARNILVGGLSRIRTGAPPEALRCRSGKEVVFGGYDQWYSTPHVHRPAPISTAPATTNLKRARPSPVD